MIKIEMGLPPDEAEIFQGINFIARQTDSYSPQESAKSFSELMGALYDQLPYEVRKKLEENAGVKKFPGELER